MWVNLSYLFYVFRKYLCFIALSWLLQQNDALEYFRCYNIIYFDGEMVEKFQMSPVSKEEWWIELSGSSVLVSRTVFLLRSFRSVLDELYWNYTHSVQ
jgi:hypothetical protein